MKLMGFVVPYDSSVENTRNIKLTQFKSEDEYADALETAFMLMEEFKPVPEPLRTKLILEMENRKKTWNDFLLGVVA